MENITDPAEQETFPIPGNIIKELENQVQKVQIGGASCGEGVKIWVAAGSIKKKTTVVVSLKKKKKCKQQYVHISLVNNVEKQNDDES